MDSVAIITPYYKESISLIRHAHESVLSQTADCLHVLVADGHSHSEIDAWNAEHIILPRSHHDIGSTPRLIGAMHAIGLGVNAVAFLDADNWYEVDYISSMMKAAWEQEADFVSSSRSLFTPKGDYIGHCPNTDPEVFVDTNCMLFRRQAFHLLHYWTLMPSYGHLIGDRIILHYLKNSDVKRIHLNEHKVCYRCSKAGIYRQLSLPIPEGVTEPPSYHYSFQKWVEDGNPPLA
jgi:glycosyltransferase involved in cell wall biosynthesis